jgi:tetratricopeptide (TPR) repeat protein
MLHDTQQRPWWFIGGVALWLLVPGGLNAQEHQHPPGMRTAESASAPTPLYENLGSLHHTVTTEAEKTQQYFDQGLRLTYAFNHDEAVKSFKQALAYDSTCAMCYWGIAYALGPNINLPMDSSVVRPAWDASYNAVRLSVNVSPKERAYIDALSKRYSADPRANRASMDTAWARAIGAVSRKYPDDDDAAVLYAEALMDLRPWSYWSNAGKSLAPSTKEQVKVLEQIVKRNPDHPGACHFYIHAIEASPDARKALPCAQRLGSLMPGAGHLVHMPTHIYIKLGEWDLAAEHNEHALHADEEFINERHPTGVYPLGYYTHNFHVMWYALNMLGRSEDALKTARTIGEKIPPDVVKQIPSLEYYSPALLYTWVRFSRWDDILRQPAPASHLRYTTGSWHYARALAYTAKDQPDSAAIEQDALVAIVETMPADLMMNLNSGKALLEIAKAHLAGEMAAEQGRVDEAVVQLQAAIQGEDQLIYEEPPAWYMPLRQRLGAILLSAGRPGKAEKIFRDDLDRRPENGWSLYGLAQSLRAQNKVKAAGKIEKRFEEAWKTADVKLALR